MISHKSVAWRLGLLTLQSAAFGLALAAWDAWAAGTGHLRLAFMAFLSASAAGIGFLLPLPFEGFLRRRYSAGISRLKEGEKALEIARAQMESELKEQTSQHEMAVIAARERADRSARESEERHRRLIELSPDAIVIQAEGRVASVNGAALALFGAKSPLELLGRPISDFTPQETREEWIARIRRAYEGSRHNKLYEERLARLDGTTVDVEVASIMDEHQGKPAVLVSLRDITRRKEVERMKSEFVSTVSHELRTPLTSIQGSLGLIANGVMGELPPQAKPLVGIAYKNCQRLVLLINDILDVEKIAEGKMRFSFKPLDLGALVEQSIESNRAFGAQFGVTFTLANEAPGDRASADSDRLIQVFTNLLSNAAKFSPPGASVLVTVSKRDQSLRVAVADRGPGIPEEFRKRIFQKFSQADGSNERQKGGTGLGLVICKSIVERHGGRISFESEAGKGTTFFVDLPILSELGADERRPAPSTAPHALICEGDAPSARFIRMILSEEGIESDLAGTAGQAATMLKEKPYDFMILDLELPDQDGGQVLRNLRSEPSTRHLPVIVVSAIPVFRPDILPESARRVIECLDKPIDPQRLHAAARAALEARRVPPARVLHVEADADVRRLVSYTLRTAAELIGATRLDLARQALERESFDLVLVNGRLPDGPGTELEPLLVGRTPFIYFNAKREETGGTNLQATALARALAACPHLPQSIDRWVRSGTHLRPVSSDLPVPTPEILT